MFHNLKDMIFLDTEFIEFPGTLELISIGMISGDGQQYYAVADFDESILKVAPSRTWLNENVMPHIKNERRKSKAQIRDEVLAFVSSVTDRPMFCGSHCDYDWVAFCWLFGSMMDLPENYPQYCWDIKQFRSDNHVPDELRPPNPRPHHALWDAMQERTHYKAAVKWLTEPKSSNHVGRTM